MKVGGGKPRSVTNPVIQALRQLVKANENYQKHYVIGWQPSQMTTRMRNLRNKLERKTMPRNKNTAQKLKFASLRYHMYAREPQRERLTWKKAANAHTKAQEKIKSIYGYGRVGSSHATKLLTLAEMGAARTIAKALRSNAVQRRLENKRRFRNFTRTELSLYRPTSSNRLIRPSNVKSRRINNPFNM
jgi:hypothetical protein